MMHFGNGKLYPEMNPEERERMWDKVADYLAMPEEERNPPTNIELYEKIQIPESTFYDKLRDERFMGTVVKKSLIQAKKYMPKVLSMMKKNIDKGQEKSMEMFIKYVGDVADKIDHTVKSDLTSEDKEKLQSLLTRKQDESNPTSIATSN